MKNERWLFTEKIWDNITDPLPRLVFADWLDENKQKHAAQRQREFAILTQNLLYVHRMFTSKDKYAAYFKANETHVCSAIIKRDGQFGGFKKKNADRLLQELINYRQRWLKAGRNRFDVIMENTIFVSIEIMPNVCEVA